MNRDNLIDAIGLMSDDMIEQTAVLRMGEPTQTKDSHRENYGKTIGNRRIRFAKYTAVAAGMLLIAVAGYTVFRIRPFIGNNNMGAGESGMPGATYMSYDGPVFPITLASEDNDISCERNVDYDFSSYKPVASTYEISGKTYTDEEYRSESIVTDDYVLYNRSDTDKRITLIYPFAASLNDSKSDVPVITVDGVEVKCEPVSRLAAGGYAGGFEGADSTDDMTLNLDEPDSWEVYKKLFDGDYMQGAFEGLNIAEQMADDGSKKLDIAEQKADDGSEKPDIEEQKADDRIEGTEQNDNNINPVLEQKVVVYELYDMYGDESKKAPAPTVSLEFAMDSRKTRILTYGFNGYSIDEETGLTGYNAFIPVNDKTARKYMIVVGEDIGDYKVVGYIDGSCEKKMDNAGGNVTHYECSFGEIFHKLVKDYCSSDNAHTAIGYADYNDDNANILDLIGEEYFEVLAADMLGKYGVFADDYMDRYSDGMLDSIFLDILSVQRVMYLSFDVEIPAKGKTEIGISMIKEASCNFIGDDKELDGYDMVTKLGSNVSFDTQTASVSNTDEIEIADQNFGFDIDNGVTKVELNVDDEHYYMNVRKKEE